MSAARSSGGAIGLLGSVRQFARLVVDASIRMLQALRHYFHVDGLARSLLKLLMVSARLEDLTSAR